MDLPGGVAVQGTQTLAGKVEVRGEERVEKQSDRRHADGGHASRKLTRVHAAVSIFVEQENAFGSARHGDHVVELANLGRAALAQNIDGVVFDTLGRAE